MAYSRVGYTANGTQTEFTIPFHYLHLDTLQVRANDLAQVRGVDYTVDTVANKIVFNTAPWPNVPVTIKRVTPRNEDERLVIFTDPSDIRAEVLNNSDLQLLYILQEALDDIAAGLGVGVPTGPTDPDAPLPVNVENALDGLNSSFVAALLAETNARAAALLAEHNDRVAALLGETNARQAAIASEQTTRQTAIDSLASSISAVSASLGTTNALVTAESTARASADTAQASRISTLEASLNTPTTGLLARMSTVEGALTTGADLTALAFRVTTLETAVADGTTGLAALSSRITSEQSSRSSADASIAASVSTVSATVGTLSATVSAEASARAAADSSLAAEYVLSVATDGPGGTRRITGFRITNQGGAGGGTEFVVQTDKFILVNSSGANARIPFQVIGGVTYIDDAIIRQLTAGKLTSGSISGQDIVLSTSGSTLATFKSSNYVTGSAGFILRSDGYFECTNGVFRGAVYLTNTIDYSSVSGSKPPAGADVTLSALNGGLNLTGGGLTLSGSSPTIKSSNYSAGVAGWLIRGDGSVEFSQGVFRGDLLIGTTSTTPGYGNTTTGFAVESANGTWFASRANNFLGSMNRNNNGDALLLRRSDVQVGTIAVSTTTTFYNTTSDRRMKTNIEDASYQGDRLDRIRLREFEFKHHAGVKFGVIAQELYEEFPNVVYKGSEGDDLESEGATWAVDYSKLVPYLIQEIQSLRKRVKALE